MMHCFYETGSCWQLAGVVFLFLFLAFFASIHTGTGHLCNRQREKSPIDTPCTINTIYCRASEVRLLFYGRSVGHKGIISILELETPNAARKRTGVRAVLCLLPCRTSRKNTRTYPLSSFRGGSPSSFLRPFCCARGHDQNSWTWNSECGMGPTREQRRSTRSTCTKSISLEAPFIWTPTRKNWSIFAPTPPFQNNIALDTTPYFI